MDWVYRGFETSLLGLAFCLGLAACLTLGTGRMPADTLSVTLPMLTVTAPRALKRGRPRRRAVRRRSRRRGT